MMRNGRWAAPLTAVTILLLLAPATRAGRSWVHADFSEDVRRPTRVVLLPVQASIVRPKINDAEPLIKETATLESAIVEGVVRALGSKGYEVDADALSPESLRNDRELQDLVDTFTTRLGEVMRQVGQKPKGIRQGRYTIGDAALPLATATDTDGLLIVLARSVIPSKGTRALTGVLSTLFGGIPQVPTTQTQAQAILVDGSSGDLLLLAVGATGGAVLKEPETVAVRVVSDTFSAYPAAGVARTARKRARERADAATERRGGLPPAPEEVDPEAAVAEFEALAGEVELPEDDADDDEQVVSLLSNPNEQEREEEDDPQEVVALLSQPQPGPPSGTGAALAPEPAGLDGRPTPDELASRPAASRPEPTHAVSLMGDGGGPAVIVVNASADEVLVSVDGRPWVALAAGARHRQPVVVGTHRVLVADPEATTELARASCIVSGDRAMVAEVTRR